MLQTVKLPSGFFNDGTMYSAKGRWFSGDKIRFREGFPEKIGGWVTGRMQFDGICRDLFAWYSLNNTSLLGIGTNLHYYVASNNVVEDVTPILPSGTTTQDSKLSTTAGSSIVHAALTNMSQVIPTAGYYVTISGVSASVGGLTPAQLNGTWLITHTSGFTIDVDVGTLAVSTAGPGGGTGVQYDFQIGPGAESAGGWGSGPWGIGSWGGTITPSAQSRQPRIWSSDAFGEDLFFGYRGGGLYLWDFSAGGPGVALEDLSGADEAPTVANWVMVSPADRHAFAFGCNEIGSSTQDPLLVRWSDAEDITNWNPDITNSSGSLRLSAGSSIYTAAITKGQIIVWTDTSLHALLFVGGDLTYGTQIISPNLDIIGPNAAISVGDFAMWMGRQNFYIYDGTVRTLPCDVRDYVFSDINLSQGFKVYAASNGIFREIWFFYPSQDSSENDRYVVFNYVDQAWYFGNMERTAWIDRGAANYPQAASTDGMIYLHEVGNDDGSTEPASVLEAYVQSGPIEMGDGDSFAFLSRVVPDVTFENSTITSPSVDYSVTPWQYPGGEMWSPDDLTTTRTQSAPVQLFTPKLDMRLRGRHLILMVENEGQTGVSWRLGLQRFDLQPDGRR